MEPNQCMYHLVFTRKIYPKFMIIDLEIIHRETEQERPYKYSHRWKHMFLTKLIGYPT